MFNVPMIISFSSSSSNLIFNHQHPNMHYHPFNRISTTYYPINEFDNNHLKQNYDHHPTWNDNKMRIENQTNTSRGFKRRVSANKKERRRTQSINTTFSDLRTAIPNVQPDTRNWEKDF